MDFKSPSKLQADPCTFLWAFLQEASSLLQLCLNEREAGRAENKIPFILPTWLWRQSVRNGFEPYHTYFLTRLPWYLPNP